MSEQINRTAQHRIGTISMHEVKVRKLTGIYVCISVSIVYTIVRYISFCGSWWKKAGKLSSYRTK